MTFVYILLLRSKSIFQALEQLEEGADQAFYNSVLLVSRFWVCFPTHGQAYLGTLAGSCRGEGQTLQIKTGYGLCGLCSYR